jgi:hypothetical protein
MTTMQSSVQQESATRRLLLFLLVSTLFLLGRCRSALALNTARAATTIRRCKSEVDVLLRVEAHNERGNIHDLLANAGNLDS